MLGEYRELKSTAWAGPFTGQAEGKGRGRSGVRMLGNPSSSGWFRGPITSPAPPHSTPWRSMELLFAICFVLFFFLGRTMWHAPCIGILVP